MASLWQDGISSVNPMPVQKLFSLVGLMAPVGFIALISTWATTDQAASWEAAIIASIMIALVVHQRKALTARRLQQHARTHRTDRSTARPLQQHARTPGSVNHVTPKMPTPCIVRVKPADSVVDVLREKLGVDAPRGKDFFDVFARKTVELTKLHSWLDEIEATPHQADRGETFIFSLLVRISARLNDVRRLERALQCMELCCVPITVSMYTELISRLGKKGDMARAKLWFEKMTTAGLKGDAQTYSSLIHGCAKVGNIEDAESWYNQMLSAGVAPTEVTFNSMVNVCARSRRPDLAEQWFCRMEDMGMSPTMYTFNSLIHALARADQTERAEHWLMDMIRRGLHPDVVSFSTIIHALPHQKGQSRVMQADRLLRNMLERGLTCSRQMPHNFRCVIQVCARGREMKLAEHWLNVAEKSEYNVGRYCYKFVACAYELLGQPNDAAVLRQRMKGLSMSTGIDQRRPVSSSEGEGSDGGKRV